MTLDPSAGPGPETDISNVPANGAQEAPRRMEQLSPSLANGHADEAAFEIKYLLEEAVAQQVESWAQKRLAYDAHGDAARGHGYRTVSLYLDTPALDVFHGTGDFKGRKVRVRRYGDAPWVYLERKTRRGDRVQKLRCQLALDGLPLLAEAAPEIAPWYGELIQWRPLRPMCVVGYDRIAHVGGDASVPLRLTLDRHITCLPCADWLPADFLGGKRLLEGLTILELKFRGTLPFLFKQLLTDLPLVPAAASKYRLAMRAWGLAEEGHA